jgi:hypothetical protein
VATTGGATAGAAEPALSLKRQGLTVNTQEFAQPAFQRNIRRRPSWASDPCIKDDPGKAMYAARLPRFHYKLVHALGFVWHVLEASEAINGQGDGLVQRLGLDIDGVFDAFGISECNDIASPAQDIIFALCSPCANRLAAVCHHATA